jgi:hypothetical protein
MLERMGKMLENGWRKRGTRVRFNTHCFTRAREATVISVALSRRIPPEYAAASR